MKRILTLLAGLTLALAVASPAVAARSRALGVVDWDLTPHASVCAMPTGWYDNSPDEDARKPTVTPAGLGFTGDQLIHRASAPLKLADLHPGTFHADKTPDQDSFFSVEVRDATTGGYGTLRWNTTTSKWDLTTNTSQFHFDHPADAIGTQTKFGLLTDATRVITFGVGYTASPPGTVAVVVSSVTFDGKTYDLTCHPAGGVSTGHPHPTKPTSTPSTKPPTTKPTPPPTATPTSKTPSTPPVGGDAGANGTGTGALAITGINAWEAAAAGVGLLAFGGAVFLVLRRHRWTFEA